MAQKSNKIKYNLKNVHVAKMTINEDGTFSYGVPKHIPGAVSLTLDAEGDNTPFYADGIVYFRTISNNGYTGSLEMALIPDWFRAVDHAMSILKPGGLIGVVDFYVARKFPHQRKWRKEIKLEIFTKRNFR